MSYLIKELPINERPREKLLNSGANNLSDSEILSIILKCGTISKSVNDLSIEIIKIIGFDNLKNTSLEELKKIKGIGDAKAIELIAAVELGRRLFLRDMAKKKKLLCAKDIWLDAKYLFYNLNQECFYAYYFNNKQELIKRKLIFKGTVNQATTHTRDVFREAYKENATSIVCLHNHPSNDTTPSKADIIFTRSLMKTGVIQKIPVVDHIIVGDDNYYSFYDNQDILNI